MTAERPLNESFMRRSAESPIISVVKAKESMSRPLRDNLLWVGLAIVAIIAFIYFS
jgi:hypothetical protein